jgi:hypothetical protein
VRLIFQHVWDDLFPVVAATKVLLVQPDIDTARTETFGNLLGPRLVAYFVAEEGNRRVWRRRDC